MVTITRTPSFITVPLHQLQPGMNVVDEYGIIGSIIDIEKYEDFPIKVVFDGVDKCHYYTADGFENHFEDCEYVHELNQGIKLVEEKPAELVSNSTTNGLTAKEMNAVNELVKKRNMTRADAIMFVIE
jgi:hypothetical protein